MTNYLQVFRALSFLLCLGLSVQVAAQNVFINEIHYDNVGADANEGVELAGLAGTNLAGWQLVPYNGANGQFYSSLTLSATIPDQQAGFGTVFFPIAGLQNGAPDGLALVDAEGNVLQFLSYEGAFTAANGPASGLTSTDIGVQQGSSTPVGFSLQLTGTGFSYADFTWGIPMANTYGSINTGQGFGSGGIDPDPDPEPDPEPQQATISEARSLPLGTQVIVSGTLTVADELGGPAFIQDGTGGMAVFDAQVHTGAFSIGDSIQVTASIGQFNQMMQLVDITSLESFGPAANPIEPVQVSISELGGHEGELVTIPNASFSDTRGLLFPESNYAIADGTGTTELRIDGDVESLVGRLKPQNAGDITGVAGSFRGTLQILPRFIKDLPGTRPYIPEGTDIPISTTLDVMTWNMEFFGATQSTFGPADDQLQLQNAKRLIDSVDADIIAVQEVSDENLLQQLTDLLPGYARICSDRYSYSFNGPDPTFPPQKVCFLYNTEVITVVDERVLFEALYDSARAGFSTPLSNYPTGDPSSFWSSGRLPYLLTVEAEINGVTERIQLINIHAKSGSGSADLTRRLYDVQALKDTLDQYYPNANLILLGDYNDDVDESIGEGPSTYSAFVQDEEFSVVTSTLSEAGLRSFITQDNVIDHITISNELYDNYLAGSETLIIPFSYIKNYVNTTSDHLPVLTRFELTEPLSVTAGPDQAVYYGYAPASCATLSGSAATGGTPGYTYTWSTGETGQTIEVCPQETTVYTVTVTDARGVTFTDSLQVCVIDVSCGNPRNPKVQVHYNPSGRPGKGKTLCVSERAVQTHLALGATLGNGEVTACEGIPVPVEEFDLKEYILSFLVYPNPISDYLSILFDNLEDGDVEVVFYNKAGVEVYRKIHQIKDDTLDLDIRKIPLSQGLNYLKVNSQYGSRTIRLIKN